MQYINNIRFTRLNLTVMYLLSFITQAPKFDAVNNFSFLQAFKILQNQSAVVSGRSVINVSLRFTLQTNINMYIRFFQFKKFLICVYKIILVLFPIENRQRLHAHCRTVYKTFQSRVSIILLQLQQITKNVFAN